MKSTPLWPCLWFLVLLGWLYSCSTGVDTETPNPDPAPQPDSQPPPSGSWELTFEDEFDDGALDREKWDPYYTWGDPQTKEHHHNYDAWIAEENAIEEDSTLRLKLEDEPSEGYTYTSAAVTATEFRARQGYYYEGRFKIPEGYRPTDNGLWPAFWLTGRRNWPPEIDIFEFFGHNDQYQAAVHYGEEEQISATDVSTPTATDRFHTYGVHWRDDQRVTVYFDGEIQDTLHKVVPEEDMVMIINFGVHGPGDDEDWLGDASNNNFPLYLEADWIRVWEPDSTGGP